MIQRGALQTIVGGYRPSHFPFFATPGIQRFAPCPSVAGLCPCTEDTNSVVLAGRTIPGVKPAVLPACTSLHSSPVAKEKSWISVALKPSEGDTGIEPE